MKSLLLVALSAATATATMALAMDDASAAARRSGVNRAGVNAGGINGRALHVFGGRVRLVQKQVCQPGRFVTSQAGVWNDGRLHQSIDD